MSGPTMQEQLYGSVDWSERDVSRLRDLADDAESGRLIGSDELPAEEIASELRETADEIEAALETIDKATGEGYNELVYALQNNLSGDTGPSKVTAAWDSFSE